jgi:enterobactin synthetase component D
MARWGRVPADISFDLRLDHGRCVGVRLPDARGAIDGLVESALAPEERVHAETLSVLRRRTWVGGRVALRLALSRSGLDAPAVLADARGAPMLPAGVSGSISHKDSLAVALVDRGAGRVGVDVEIDGVRSRDIASRVLTDEEVTEIAALDDAARAREVLLRFSAKEAIYKALDPFLQRYVGFKEVSVVPRAGGEAHVQARLRVSEGPFTIEARWLRFDGLILTTARVERR